MARSQKKVCQPPVLSTEELFDLVAPIAIYHGADVCFKERAKTAYATLLARKDSPEVAALMDLGDAEYDLIAGIDLPGRRAFNSPNTSSTFSTVYEVYDYLFDQVVRSVEGTADWTITYDRAGCRCYEVYRHARPELAGDSPWRFAWYARSALLKDRTAKLVAEYAAELAPTHE